MNLLLNELYKTKANITKMGLGDKSIHYNKNLIEFIEFINIIDASILICLCAIERKESRGSHFRTDFPKIDIKFEKNSLVKKFQDKTHINFEDIR